MLRTNDLFLSFIETLYHKQTEEHITCRKFAKGKLLCMQGEAHYKVSVIKEGIVKCYYSEDNGKDYTFEFLSRGEIIGEIESLRQCSCYSNVEAVSDVQVYSFSASFFNYLCNTNHQFCRLLLKEMAERMVNTGARAVYQQLHPIRFALAKLLDIQKEQSFQLSKADMASYLGIDVRSLNRILKEIADNPC